MTDFRAKCPRAGTPHYGCGICDPNLHIVSSPNSTPSTWEERFDSDEGIGNSIDAWCNRHSSPLRAKVKAFIAQKREEAKREVVEFIREIASSYQSPIGTVYRVAESTLTTALMTFTEEDDAALEGTNEEV